MIPKIGWVFLRSTSLIILANFGAEYSNLNAAELSAIEEFLKQPDSKKVVEKLFSNLNIRTEFFRFAENIPNSNTLIFH